MINNTDTTHLPAAPNSDRIKPLIEIVMQHYPNVQAIYLFGTFNTTDQRPESDVDIGLLFEHRQAKTINAQAFFACRLALETVLHKDVDLINMRAVNTVFQKEIIAANRRIYQKDEFAAAEFEMLTLSYYQQLNHERAAIIEDILKSGLVYAP